MLMNEKSFSFPGRSASRAALEKRCAAEPGPVMKTARPQNVVHEARARDVENDMSIADMVYEQVKTLPEPLAREVLDFVGYLRDSQDHADRRDLMNAQTGSLAGVWDNAEDKVWDDA
jgi:hypothetical protein